MYDTISSNKYSKSSWMFDCVQTKWLRENHCNYSTLSIKLNLLHKNVQELLISNEN